MHLWRMIALRMTKGVLTGVLTAVALGATAAVIYKWTDADGVVHYSDQPVPGAQKIVTSSVPALNTMPASPPAPPYPAAAPASKPGYTLAIDSPTPEATYFAGPVSVRAHLTPGLDPGQTVSWTLNGQPLEQPPTALEFALNDMARGGYTLNATVSDAYSHDVLAAASVTFYVKQPTIFSPAHK
jgi:hypothetical protein